MTGNNKLRLLWKILIYLQIPVYILLIKYLVSFIVKIDGSSESVDMIFTYVLWIMLVCFVLSGIISSVLLISVYFRKKILFAAIAFLLGIILLYTYIFNFAAHWMFILIPVIVVLYHVVIFTVYGKMDENPEVTSV